MKIKDIIEDYLKDCSVRGGRLNTGNDLKTINEKRRFLFGPIYRAVGEKEIGDIDEFDFANVAAIGKEYGIFGSQRSWLYFRQLLKFARRRGHKINIDFSDLRMPIVPEKDVEYLTPDELNKVRGSFDLSTMAGLRTRTILEFIMGTGLRIKEVCSLNIKDINFETGELRFINCKTKEKQETVCPPSALIWLRCYLSKRKDNNPALFISGRDRLLPVSSRNYIRTHVRHLGIPKTVAHHIIRKTVGTNLLLDTDLKAVQNFLRHKSPEVTLKFYTAVTKVQTRAATAKITDKYVALPGD